MGLDAECLKLFWCRYGAGQIVPTVEMSTDRHAGLSSGGTNEVKDLVIAVEGFASPVFGDLGEQTMLDGIPFGSTCGVVSDGSRDAERVAQLSLDFGFSGP